MRKIKLVEDTIDKEDVDRLISWLGNPEGPPRLTKGPITVEFEDKWSNWLGVKNTVFCNSGSSANLLMLWALVETGRIKQDAKVVVPAISWATDLAPVIQLGMTPLLCDCNLDDLSIDLDAFEKLVEEQKPEVLILVSVLGLVPDMERIVQICNDNNVILLEDTCESMGSDFKGRKLGTFGLMSSFSTYFGHHISTIEGGLVCTDDDELFEVLKSIRSHGWLRDSSSDFKKEMLEKWNVNEFESLYKFFFSGFNLRATDLQAFIGIGQIDKLDNIVKKRKQNFQFFNENLKETLPNLKVRPNTTISNFAYPVISPRRTEIVSELIENNIEVRPLICGSMATQPYYVKKYGTNLQVPNSFLVDSQGFYIPNHPNLSEEDMSLIVTIIKGAGK